MIVLVPTYVTDVATSHGLSSSVAANIPVVAYGVVLIAVMLLFSDGIQGAVRRLLRPALPAASGSLTALRHTERPSSLDAFRRQAPAGEHPEEGTQ